MCTYWSFIYTEHRGSSACLCTSPLTVCMSCAARRCLLPLPGHSESQASGHAECCPARDIQLSLEASAHEMRTILSLARRHRAGRAFLFTSRVVRWQCVTPRVIAPNISVMLCIDCESHTVMMQPILEVECDVSQYCVLRSASHLTFSSSFPQHAYILP